MSYYISTLWITRHSEDTPELIQAWDNFSVDDNPDGFTKACRESLAEIGDDVRDTAYLTIVVPEDPIFAALYPQDIVVDAQSVTTGHEDAPA